MQKLICAGTLHRTYFVKKYTLKRFITDTSNAPLTVTSTSTLAAAAHNSIKILLNHYSNLHSTATQTRTERSTVQKLRWKLTFAHIRHRKVGLQAATAGNAVMHIDTLQPSVY